MTIVWTYLVKEDLLFRFITLKSDNTGRNLLDLINMKKSNIANIMTRPVHMAATVPINFVETNVSAPVGSTHK